MREPNPPPSVGFFATSTGSFAVPIVVVPTTSLLSLSGTDRYQQKVNDTLTSTHTPRCLRRSSFLPSGITGVLFYRKNSGEDQLR